MHFFSDDSAFSHNKTSWIQSRFNLARSHAAALFLALFFGVALIGNVSYGQEIPDVPPPPSHEVALQVDSGMVTNEGVRRESVWNETITVKGAKWLRLNFSEVVLTKGRKQESRLRITSLEDGAVQILDAECCEQWRNKSAFFNGDSVKVELLAHAKSEGNCVVIESVTAGEVAEQVVAESLCDDDDDRVLSNSRRVARIDIGCTAWLFNGRSNDMITAGHCAPTMQAVFFNVPVSDPDGTINFPSPDDQYAICIDSVQFQNEGVGNDWCVFGVFNNSNTGLSPFAAQGASYTLTRPGPNTFDTNDFIRITGFGTTVAPVDPTFNQAQKTNAGRFVSLITYALNYRPDTSGGDSGSPVTRGSTNRVYGVHTHGGCTLAGRFNSGTGLNHPLFWEAINNPQGVCIAPDPLENDNCENAIAIGSGSFDFDTRAATTDGPALPPSCDEGFGLSLVKDIWFKYTSPCTGSVNFDFCDSGYDTRVAAYTSDGCPGVLLACDDDACGVQSEMTIDVVLGETYLIRVGGFAGGGPGTMVVTESQDCICEFMELVDGNLIIMATQMPDVIDISFIESLEVNVNDVCIETFEPADVDRVIIFAYGGSDEIFIFGGVEATIYAGHGADRIQVGDSPAEIFGGPGPDFISGSPAKDFLYGGAGRDTIFAEAGADEIFGGDAADLIIGGPGNDMISGGLGPDFLLGEGGNDLIVGNAGADRLNGGGGNDVLVGSDGPDVMFGGAGEDEFTGGAGFDTMEGGPGIDTSLDDGEIENDIEN